MSRIDTQEMIAYYFQAITRLEQEVLEGQSEMLHAVAVEMARTVLEHQRIFLFGTGHSHMMAEEGFYRAGGLANVVPIFMSSLMLHGSPTLSGRLERTPGLAAPLLDDWKPQAGELIFIYSNSGVNQLPVEMALEAKARGMRVVSVSARKYANVAPLSVIGKRLYEVSDYAIDNGGQPGDALLAIEGMPWRAGASSTVINALIWNALVCQTVANLTGKMDQLPLIASLNLPGAAEHNEAIFEAWKDINPYLGR